MYIGDTTKVPLIAELDLKRRNIELLLYQTAEIDLLAFPSVS